VPCRPDSHEFQEPGTPCLLSAPNHGPAAWALLKARGRRRGDRPAGVPGGRVGTGGEGGGVAARKGLLTVTMILAWADAHRARTGRWPLASSGAVTGAPGEHWRALDSALRHGGRGLPAGSSLSRLLEERRGVPRWGGRCRGLGPKPWTPEEEELVRNLPPKQAAGRTGRSLAAVYHRRRRLGMPCRGRRA
jgi:hypothetical protein